MQRAVDEHSRYSYKSFRTEPYTHRLKHTATGDSLKLRVQCVSQHKRFLGELNVVQIEGFWHLLFDDRLPRWLRRKLDTMGTIFDVLFFGWTASLHGTSFIIMSTNVVGTLEGGAGVEEAQPSSDAQWIVANEKVQCPPHAKPQLRGSRGG